MPIRGAASYVSTTQEFSAHWGAADATLGVGNEVVLPGGIFRATLDSLLTTLEAKRALVQGKLNLAETARGAVEDQKAALLLRLDQFNEKVRAQLPGSKYERALPNIPSITQGQGNIVQPLDEAARLWVQIIADPATGAPLTLLGGYTHVNFDTDIAALKAAYKTWVGAETVATVTREERNDIQDQIYPILLAYRKNLPTHFAKTHALVESLPRLTPEPGSTPQAVTATVTWDEAQQMFKITWTASSDVNLAQYEIRFVAGPVYSTDTENVIGNVLPGAAREFFTASGAASPGDIGSFKVYVITNNRNEK